MQLTERSTNPPFDLAPTNEVDRCKLSLGITMHRSVLLCADEALE